MARKKARPARPPQEGPRGGGSTAVVAQPAVTGLTATPAAPAPAKPLASVKVKKTGPAYLASRLLHWLGSLQIAVPGLILFAFCLALGTVLEHAYSDKVARELVYRSWWFTLLIGILGVNIFCAAAKKWPWKKHQTGFVITHAGLLLLVAGGVLNALWGVDALVAMIDSSDSEAHEQAGLGQTTTQMIDINSGQITVSTPSRDGKDRPKSYEFDPGSLAWRPEQFARPRFDPLLSVLRFMAHPLPYEWSQTLPDGAELEVLAYYPYTRKGQFQAASDKKTGSEETFPAIQFALSSPMAGTLPESWVALRLGSQVHNMGPSMVEFLGTCPAGMLDEFGNPPAPDAVGKKGQLVLSVDGKKYRFAVDRCVGQGEQPLGDTGWKVKIGTYIPDVLRDSENPEAAPSFPALDFSVIDPAGKVTPYKVLARYSGRSLGDKGRGEEAKGVEFWYHPADYRYGNPELRGLLQFVQGDDGKLYYRSFDTSKKGAFAFEKGGRLARSHATLDIWGGMNWKFQLLEYLPEAVREEPLVPVDLRPGSTLRQGITPAARCRITKGSDKQEFWLPMERTTEVTLGKQVYQVRYDVHSQDLGCKLKLLRAEQTNDAGTQSPATYTSFVQLTDDEQHIKDEDHVITMNAPLHHRGYKFYQSGLEPVSIEQGSLKPISKTTLTVSYDPGIYLKYLGQVMLGLGIFTMFYMKAYFFKPRGKRAPAAPAAAAANGTPAQEV
jgi:hypothetical protein